LRLLLSVALVLGGLGLLLVRLFWALVHLWCLLVLVPLRLLLRVLLFLVLGLVPFADFVGIVGGPLGDVVSLVPFGLSGPGGRWRRSLTGRVGGRGGLVGLSLDTETFAIYANMAALVIMVMTLTLSPLFLDMVLMIVSVRLLLLHMLLRPPHTVVPHFRVRLLKLVVPIRPVLSVTSVSTVHLTVSRMPCPVSVPVPLILPLPPS